ncbi:hypothetical protein CLV28_0646 [Sediminihabitans luteus]|uniref:Uncharacterized protein n=1 Tax=Sediminihabitans luteus TaxID=1138585 RepID=A0A2M9CZV9_9CELL|nr:hypothetical protein CLV28_0646 [Sediminihabitans luteus]
MADLLERAVEAMYESTNLDEHKTAARVYQRAQQLRLGDFVPFPERRASVDVDPDLPAMAWTCRVADGQHDFRVGPSVESGPGHVFEGVWDGAFTDLAFHRTDLAFGSGARIGKHVVFVPPKHCWEYLYVLHDRETGVTTVSNSLPATFVEGLVDDDDALLDEVGRVLRTSTDTASALGFDRYDPVVVDGPRHTFRRMMFHNFVVGADGGIKIFPSEPHVLFRTFAEYREYLTSAIRRLAENGADPGRTCSSLVPVTPLSNGYDSPAVAALASELGFTRAVTLDVTVKGRDDSGRDVGRRLGMEVDVVRHVMGDEVPSLALTIEDSDLSRAAEFVATAGLGDDVMLTTMESSLRSGILLSGAMGDSAWKRACTLPPGLPVRVIYGKSFTEFRLRTGYAFVPVPAIGARFVAPIRRVTRSEEMAPWTLNQPYDRPVPRRIVEEAGVPRGTFAKAKAATNPTVLNNQEIFGTALRQVMERYRTADRAIRHGFSPDRVTDRAVGGGRDAPTAMARYAPTGMTRSAGETSQPR